MTQTKAYISPEVATVDTPKSTQSFIRSDKGNLLWSKDANTGGITTEGKRIRLGYINQALAVFRAPEEFSEPDRVKTRNILRESGYAHLVVSVPVTIVGR